MTFYTTLPRHGQTLVSATARPARVPNPPVTASNSLRSRVLVVFVVKRTSVTKGIGLLVVKGKFRRVFCPAVAGRWVHAATFGTSGGWTDGRGTRGRRTLARTGGQGGRSTDGRDQYDLDHILVIIQGNQLDDSNILGFA